MPHPQGKKITTMQQPSCGLTELYLVPLWTGCPEGINNNILDHGISSNGIGTLCLSAETPRRGVLSVSYRSTLIREIQKKQSR
jgi:hypothetical protein